MISLSTERSAGNFACRLTLAELVRVGKSLRKPFALKMSAVLTAWVEDPSK
jgi:hypothetical protein